MRRAIIGLAAVALVSCAGIQKTESAISADLITAYQHALQSLAQYKATPNPSGTVLTQAGRLEAAAASALKAYEATGGSGSIAFFAAAVAALSTYLLTAAPGDGSTPALPIPASIVSPSTPAPS